MLVLLTYVIDSIHSGQNSCRLTILEGIQVDPVQKPAFVAPKTMDAKGGEGDEWKCIILSLRVACSFFCLHPGLKVDAI